MIIDKIVEQYRPKQVPQPIPLEIVGDSAFTRALARRCAEWGVPFVRCEHPSRGTGPVVIDREVSSDTVASFRDIDVGIYKLSACAEGIAFLCGGQLDGKLLTIVGRGPAVQGLSDYLTHEGGTVSVCTSHTPPHALDTLISTADITVDTRDGVTVTTKTRTFNNAEVGRLTCAVLAHRAARW